MVEQEARNAAAPRDALAGWRSAARDLAQMLRFHSRLPVPPLPFERDPHSPPDFRRASRLLPLAGALIALPAAAALWLAASLGLPQLAAAACGVAALALVTGGLHEDGLADAFDGLASGATRERRLEIMKDSRIGSYGATALALALMLRVSLLAGAIAALGPAGAALLLIGGAAASRALMLLPMAALPPARPDGAAAAVGRPDAICFGLAAALGLALAAAMAISAGAGAAAALAGFALGLALAGAMTYWAHRAIGGHSGDVAGACQQSAEIGFHIGLLAVVNGWS